MLAGSTPVLVHNCDETYYRTMSTKHYAALQRTGRVSATGETFISPTQAFSEDYDGVLVKLTVRDGTTAKLAQIGLRDDTALTAEAYPDMPVGAGGWNKTKSYFKSEGGPINIGLGRGTALDIFNDAITGFEKVRG